jgi:hypothetical protein
MNDDNKWWNGKKTTAEMAFEHLLRELRLDRDDYPFMPPNAMNIVATRAYGACFRWYKHHGVTIRTGFITAEAQLAKTTNAIKPTADHWFPPRIFLRAVIEKRPDLLDQGNEDKLWRLFRTAQTTIDVTPGQNTGDRYSNKSNVIKVKELTINKFKDRMFYFKPNEKNPNSVLEAYHKSPPVNKGLPLVELIPEFVTEFERECMIRG